MNFASLEERLAYRRSRLLRGEPLSHDDERDDEFHLVPRRTEPKDRFFTHRKGKQKET